MTALQVFKLNCLGISLEPWKEATFE